MPSPEDLQQSAKVVHGTLAEFFRCRQKVAQANAELQMATDNLQEVYKMLSSKIGAY